ncbi:MAG TPA: lamin tail domain-containing protein, partial [bacterium]|nr:lamin tail domain-containing protein [bacterium]
MSMGDIRKILIVLIVFFAPFFAKGSVVINEIMYNLDGADKGREWVEIFNSGSAPIDLSGWKFFENKTNHKIKLAGGEENFIIPVGGYAVLADRPKKFLSDWPNFSGTIFDTAFSLKNSGEPLALRDSGLNDVDSVFYNSDWGGDGDGSSLQKIGGKWVGARPTPGALNSGQQN